MTTGDDRRVDRPRYEIEFLPGAARQLEKLPIAGRTLVVVAIDGLSEDPRPDGAKLLVQIAVGLATVVVGLIGLVALAALAGGLATSSRSGRRRRGG